MNSTQMKLSGGKSIGTIGWIRYTSNGAPADQQYDVGGLMGLRRREKHHLTLIWNENEPGAGATS